MADARDLLEQITADRIDPYEGYRRLYALYTDTNGLIDELKPLFRLPGIEPGGSLHVTEEFRWEIRRLAKEWLLDH
jgi:hypothetical protein